MVFYFLFFYLVRRQLGEGLPPFELLLLRARRGTRRCCCRSRRTNRRQQLLLLLLGAARRRRSCSNSFVVGRCDIPSRGRETSETGLERRGVEGRRRSVLILVVGNHESERLRSLERRSGGRAAARRLEPAGEEGEEAHRENRRRGGEMGKSRLGAQSSFRRVLFCGILSLSSFSRRLSSRLYPSFLRLYSERRRETERDGDGRQQWRLERKGNGRRQLVRAGAGAQIDEERHRRRRWFFVPRPLHRPRRARPLHHGPARARL